MQITHKNDTIYYANTFQNELMQFFVKISGFEIHISSLFIFAFSRIMQKNLETNKRQEILEIIQEIEQAQDSKKELQSVRTLILNATISLEHICKTCNIQYYKHRERETIQTAKRVLAFLGGINYTGETQEDITIMPLLSKGQYNKETQKFHITINPFMLAKFHKDSELGYTQTRFLEQAQLNTKNAKVLYYILKPFERQGYARFSIEYFMQQTGQTITKRLQIDFLKPSIKELNKIYPSIEWEYEKNKKFGERGAKRITHIIFKFSKNRQMIINEIPNYAEINSGRH